MSGEGAGVQRCEEEVEEVDRQGEVGHEFASRDEDDDGDGPIRFISLWKFVGDQRTYMQRPPSISHMNDNNHPRVVSPRTPSQPSIMSTLKPMPATRAVKSMRTPAVT